MTLLPRSLFGRNVLLLILLLAFGQLLTLAAFTIAVQRPRLTEMATNIAAQVRALGVALVALPPDARAQYIETLNQLDTVEIETDAKPQRGARPPVLVRYFMRELAEQLGSSADVRWQPHPRLIWIRVPVAEQSYWMQLSPQRIRL